MAKGRLRIKKNKGVAYYYIVTSERITLPDGTKGSAREKILEYIGNQKALDEYILNLRNAVEKARTNSNVSTEMLFSEMQLKSYQHGAPFELYWVLCDLGIINILDNCFKPKTIHGFSRGTILALAAIHRACDPNSKRAFAGWAENTTLPYYLGFKADDMTSQAFWEAMDGISTSEINYVQQQITGRLLQSFPIDTGNLHLDYTNYYTFIDSKNGRCYICKRGHNKQKRNDLRQFSLAVLTSYALQTPLVWDLYEGNKNDKAEFADFIDFINEQLVHGQNIQADDITITFDGGSNTKPNLSMISPMHFICCFSLSCAKELYDIDIKDYETIKLENTKTRLAYRIDNYSFWDCEGTAILTYSQDLYDGQLAELESSIDKCRSRLTDLEAKLNSPTSHIHGELETEKKLRETLIEKAQKELAELQNEEATKKRRGRKKKVVIPEPWSWQDAIQERADACLQGTHIKDIAKVVIRKNDSKVALDVVVDEKSKNKICAKFFGKKLTVTDHKDWSTERILTTYSEEECVENIFKTSKCDDHYSISPQFHWTDDKIRAHVLICVIALTIGEALRLKLEDYDVHKTREAILDILGNVREGWVILPDSSKEKPTVNRKLELMNDETKALWDIISDLHNSGNMFPVHHCN